MRFPLMFTRRKGAGEGIALGSDVAPTTPPKARAMPDNAMSLQHFATNHPARRIAVAYAAPSGVLALVGNAYAYDERTERWFRVGPANVSIEAGAITLIDVPSLVERAPLAGELGSAPSHHHVIALVVTDPGAAPNGVHTFAVGLAT